MKKPLAHTKCTVKLRKSEYHDEWYLIVESYPVFNRTVTTPIWDKNRNARTSEDGVVTYKPKRDENGIILCKSQLDQEACIYADKVRAIRQREYDNAALYTDSEAEQAAQNERSKCNFISYFKEITDKRHRNSSESINVNWRRVYELMKIFAGGDTLTFGQINLGQYRRIQQRHTSPYSRLA